MSRPRIMVCVDWFAPGYRAGGPIKSCVGFTEAMSSVCDLGVWTSDRDLGQSAPYQGVEFDRWADLDSGAKVFYAGPGNRGMRSYESAVRSFAPDWIYLNSMFSPMVAMRPLMSKLLGRTKSRVVLAPRGMLHETALKFRSWKKKPVLSLLRLAGLSRAVRFHSTSDVEEKRIRQVFGDDIDVHTVANFPGSKLSEPERRRAPCEQVELLCVGRVHPIKNTHRIFEALSGVQERCRLRVVGPAEDAEYEARCQKLAADLPDQHVVEFLGEQPPPRIADLLSECHLFVLPTQGENFGHAIFEAFAAGVPALISDQTIWRGLEARKAGWDLSLDAISAFGETISRVAAMSVDQHFEWVTGANECAREFVEHSGLIESYFDLFDIPSPHSNR